MTITLQPEQEQAIEAAIRSGAFRSVDEFLEAAIATLPGSVEPPVLPARTSGLWQLRKNLLLGNVSIKDLIEEGRE